MRRKSGFAVLACAICLLATACGSDGGGDKDGQPPSTPAGVTLYAGSSTSVHVMWNQSTDDKKVTGYQVFRDGKKVQDVPAERRMVDIAELKPSSAYTFRVRAEDAAGNLSSFSAVKSVTTPAAKADDRTPPTRPGALRGKADGSRSAVLDWTRSTDAQGVTSYEIYQDDSKIHSVDGRTTTALITDLRPGIHYTFTVKARDEADNVSPASGAVHVTTAKGAGGSAHEAPTDLRGTSRNGPGGRSIDLTWQPPTTGGQVTSYEIYLDGKFASTLVFGDVAPKGRIPYNIPVSGKPGTVYRVKVRAKLPDGKWGAFSAEKSLTLKDVPKSTKAPEVP